MEFCLKSIVKYNITNHKSGKSVKITQSDEAMQSNVVKKVISS